MSKRNEKMRCSKCLHFVAENEPCGRQLLGIPSPDTEFCSEFEKKCCGSCCWFYGELTDGWGQCMRQDICDSMHCSDLCTTDKYISKEKLRHSAAVLARFKRAVHIWDEKIVKNRPNQSDIDEAIDIITRYVNVITKKV